MNGSLLDSIVFALWLWYIGVLVDHPDFDTLPI